MRKPFSIKWIYLIERRSFDQKYKFSNKNEMVCAWKNFQKKIFGISTYSKWNFKPQISSIFHFDRVSDGGMAHILGVIEGETRSNLAAPPERFKPKDPQRCKITTSWRRYTHSAAPASMGSPEASAKERLHFFFPFKRRKSAACSVPGCCGHFPIMSTSIV